MSLLTRLLPIATFGTDIVLIQNMERKIFALKLPPKKCHSQVC